MASLSSRYLSGLCPDEKCGARLIFPSYDISVECTNCGQRHEQNNLLNLEEVTNPNVALHNIIRTLLVSKQEMKKGVEMIKVKGLSNYHCKLLSPFLTYYGMDKRTWRACPLKDLNQGEVFECALLQDRAFLIDPEHVEIIGYGRDVSGSGSYLADTLKLIRESNGGEECLVPIHADGDGHCLVHAISKSLVGRELFWHPLRICLKKHFQANVEIYMNLFKDFIDASEWSGIIAECDPEFQPIDGELLGLRNIHVFGLANVLHRPIILLDSLSGMQNPGDYSALFLPGLVDPLDCVGKSGELNKPLCIAWSSSGRNHYIPLVGIKRGHGRLPRLPRVLVPKPWGVSESLVEKYVEFDSEDYCIIGGEKCLPDNYILRLATAMEEVYLNENRVHPSIVADVHHYVYKRSGLVGVLPKEVLATTQKAVDESRLYRCLLCDGVCEHNLVPEWFFNGGALYDLAVQNHGRLRDDKLYSFPVQGVTCTYDSKRDELIPDLKKSVMEKCSHCTGNMRLVSRDGKTQYRNGDRTKSPSQSNRCNCGHKHYWDGKEYDNLPQVITVVLDWMNEKIEEKVPWFQFETDSSLNSNVYEVANGLLQKHFPGVFGIERLAQKVVDQILEKTKKPEEPKMSTSVEEEPAARSNSPSKIIIMGYKTLHKEELTKSNTERNLRQKIETNASRHQRRASADKPNVKSQPAVITSKMLTKQSASVPPGTSPKRVPSLEEKSVGSATASPVKIPATKMIRVSTCEGQQLQLSLESITTVKRLKQELEDRLGIPMAQQKILYGFPPREFTPSGDGCSLPFQHGDKLSVEVLPDPETRQSDKSISVANSDSGGFEGLNQRLRDMKNANASVLDAALTSLALSARFGGKSMWTHVQNMPNLFLPGGLFYQQVERDVGLVDGKHYHLPCLPDKSFTYNGDADRLELCIEPHGHFPIDADLSERVQTNSASNEQDDLSVISVGVASAKGLQQASTSRLGGNSGVVVSKSREMLSAHTPFQGAGHSLTGKMESVDWVLPPASTEPIRIRTGPGVSVLSAPNQNESTKTLHSLLKSLESFNNRVL
uniref:Uncharacterized protein n=1 Tax=Strigamia maritima TaxID=126957 RepID=T1J3E2_STRMM